MHKARVFVGGKELPAEVIQFEVKVNLPPPPVDLPKRLTAPAVTIGPIEGTFDPALFAYMFNDRPAQWYVEWQQQLCELLAGKRERRIKRYLLYLREHGTRDERRMAWKRLHLPNRHRSTRRRAVYQQRA